MFIRSLLLSVLVLLVSGYGLAQQDSKQDSVKVLNEVVVQAYAMGRPLAEVPASVAYLDQSDLVRFNNTSILPAVNMIPGVRMEERSPGSYRFSIRGSLLRSPFGVRNIKMYWNGMPLTDAGGNTYINLIDLNSISNIEIIKGPGASLYGAGTGGVVLLNSQVANKGQSEISGMAGSYGLWRLQGQAQMGSEKVNGVVRFANQKSDGYRDHTAMDRFAYNTDVHFNINEKNGLDVTFLYSNLYYETPGGLTRAQYEQTPWMARKGADSLNASISNKTYYVGLAHTYQWNDKWSTSNRVYGSTTTFINPTFLNYEERDERNVGWRLENQYGFEKQNWKGKITFGVEYQYFNSPIRNYTNVQGSKGTLTFEDKILANQTVLFAQGEFDLPKNFILTGGLSGTFLRYNLIRYQPDPADQTRKFDPVLAPRIAVLKKIGNLHSVYGTISYGFSPPSVAEVRPSTNEFNNELKPEHGTNYEIGLKGQTKNSTLRYELSLFEFDLKETIVMQRTSTDAEYFINAGSTRQRGAELYVSWSPVFSPDGFFTFLRFQGSQTFNNFSFDDYTYDSQVYSGNSLTGVAPTVSVFGVDLGVRSRFLMNVTMNYTNEIPLNDANSQYASEYFLFGTRIGYTIPVASGFQLDLIAGVDNLFDQTYSLGNDLNARGGRYFNAASARNFYFGIKMVLGKQDE